LVEAAVAPPGRRANPPAISLGQQMELLEVHFRLHMNTTWKVQKMIGFRDQRVKELGRGL
jgi:hypothetical protein